MKVFFLMLLLFFLFSCDPTTSDADKEKSNYSDPKKILHDYGIIRTMGGRNALGDPLCGGDPIGTALGLNNDTPVPIILEIGKTYDYEGNVNLVNATDRKYSYSNLFQISNNINKNIEVKLTLTEDCLGQGSDGFYFNVGICDANGFQYISNASNCIAGFSVLNTEQKKRMLKDDYELCTVLNHITRFFILINENGCKYKLELNGV